MYDHMVVFKERKTMDMTLVFGFLGLTGLVISALSALGSDIGMDFGGDGVEPTVSICAGLFLGAGGVVGLVTLHDGMSQVQSCIAAFVVGVVFAAIGFATIRWFVNRSSDGNERSVTDLVGARGVSVDNAVVKAGTTGQIDVTMKDNGVSRILFQSDEDVPAKGEVTIVSVERNGALVTVKPVKGTMNDEGTDSDRPSGKE